MCVGSRPEHALRGAAGGWRRRSSPAAAAAATEPGPAAAAGAAARGRGGGRGALSTRRGTALSAAGQPTPIPGLSPNWGERRRAASSGHGQRGEPGRRRRAGSLPRRGGGGCRGWRRPRGPFAAPGAGRRGGGPEPAERGGEEADRRCHVKGAGAAQREPRRRGAAFHAKARTQNRPSSPCSLPRFSRFSWWGWGRVAMQSGPFASGAGVAVCCLPEGRGRQALG